MIYVSDKCIPNEAVSTSGRRRRRRKADRVFPTGIDRRLFVFAIGLCSINPACVMITVPPCQQVTERESIREERKRAEGEVEEEREGGGGGASGGDDEEEKSGGVEMGLVSFLTHTWQMSSHRVGL